MKITVASKETTWYTQELEKAAQNCNVDINIKNITHIDDLSDVGDVIYWRSSTIENDYPTVVQRSCFLMEARKKGKIIVNDTLLTNPYLTYKSYQQSLVKKILPHITTIPTFVASDSLALKALIDTETLQFPFIAKPDHGSRGSNVSLIKKPTDTHKLQNTSEYIFQNFIPNDGDYRVYVIGGIAVEIIKRTASKGHFLNNISQGGAAQRVDDIVIREALGSLATRIASALDLSICGIDLMYNQNDQKYYFLEINTVAQWQGLQSVSPVNIADHIIHHLHMITSQQKSSHSLTKIIEEYYTKNLAFLPRAEQFHFHSRRYLYTKNNTSFHALKDLRSWYAWDSTTAQETTKNIYTLAREKKNTVINNKKFRATHAQKYPQLGAYNEIFYKTLFTHTIYGDDHRNILIPLLKKNEIDLYCENLTNDPQAILALSTHAINFLYLAQWFFYDNTDIHIQQFIDIVKIEKLKNDDDTLLSKIYLLTHCIICASLFYNQKITHTLPLYTEMITELEKLIFAHYTEITLDQKCEFLVCAQIMNHKTPLTQIIISEAHNSLSPHGNFLIDTLNKHNNTTKKDLTTSEHRNILYILSTKNI